MPSVPHHLSISAARADALFASPLQRSCEPSAGQVRQAIATTIAAYGARGCAARVAHAYGEHPDTALTRMRWALAAVASAFGGPQTRPAPSAPRPPRRAPHPPCRLTATAPSAALAGIAQVRPAKPLSGEPAHRVRVAAAGLACSQALRDQELAALPR